MGVRPLASLLHELVFMKLSPGTLVARHIAAQYTALDAEGTSTTLCNPVFSLTLVGSSAAVLRKVRRERKASLVKDRSVGACG